MKDSVMAAYDFGYFTRVYNTHRPLVTCMQVGERSGLVGTQLYYIKIYNTSTSFNGPTWA